MHVPRTSLLTCSPSPACYMHCTENRPFFFFLFGLPRKVKGGLGTKRKLHGRWAVLPEHLWGALGAFCWNITHFEVFSLGNCHSSVFFGQKHLSTSGVLRTSTLNLAKPPQNNIGWFHFNFFLCCTSKSWWKLMCATLSCLNYAMSSRIPKDVWYLTKDVSINKNLLLQKY